MSGDGTPPIDRDGQLVTSASLPTTATAITLVTLATLGADLVERTFGLSLPREYALIGFAALVSIFATWMSPLSIVWKIVLSPLNFCILVYLCFASLTLGIAAGQNEPAGAPVTSTYVIRSTPIAGTQP